MERDWYVEQRKSSGNGHSYCSHLTLVSFLLLLLLLGKTKKKNTVFVTFIDYGPGTHLFATNEVCFFFFFPFSGSLIDCPVIGGPGLNVCMP